MIWTAKIEFVAIVVTWKIFCGLYFRRRPRFAKSVAKSQSIHAHNGGLAERHNQQPSVAMVQYCGGKLSVECLGPVLNVKLWFIHCQLIRLKDISSIFHCHVLYLYVNSLRFLTIVNSLMLAFTVFVMYIIYYI